MNTLTLPVDLDRWNTPGVVARVAALPQCDLCKLHGDDANEARFDGLSFRFRQWGYMCVWHAQQHMRSLGTGAGQMLVTAGESALCLFDPENYRRLALDLPIRTPERSWA